MTRRNWTREEAIVAFNLYCKIPFSKINYKHKLIQELANAINRTPSSVAWKLVNFASLDPTLQARNIKGASNSSKLDKAIFNEFYGNWDKLIYESEIILSSLLKNEILNEDESDLIFEIPDGKVRESIVKVRVNQNFFRKMILASYSNRCCFTGLSIDSLLVASHIIPWAKDEKNRLNPENGLCLNNLHDKAFDKGFVTVDSNYKIIVSKHLRELEKDESIQRFFLSYEGREITLPNRFLPNKDFLDYHYNHIFKK